MTDDKALSMALSILESFKGAGNIYDDYKAEDGFTDEEYDEMLQVLRQTAGKCPACGSSSALCVC